MDSNPLIINEESKRNEILPSLTFTPTSLEISETTSTRSIKCLKCCLEKSFPLEKDDYLAHLFLEHRLIIADAEDIASLEEYLIFWENCFKDNEFEIYCTTMLLDQLPDGTPAKNEKYFLLSDILPKDADIRRRLQEERLEKVLARHQYERTDRTFSKECLLCRNIITGLRSEYLEHLYNKHFLQIGKPENLVYVDELLEKVEQNFEKLICLYCEKVFKDRVTLKEHMRKKGHKRINENNRDYDRFFLINYRNDRQKQTQRQTNRKQEVQRRTRQRSCRRNNADNNRDQNGTIEPSRQRKNSSRNESESVSVDFEQRFANSDNSDSDWSDWNQPINQALNCLFCDDHKETLFSRLKEHMLKEHRIDFDGAMRNFHFYQRVKIVNYVRRQFALRRCVTCNLRCETNETLQEHMNSAQHYGFGTKKEWDKPEYFFPTYEDDGVLCNLDDNPNDDAVDDTVVQIISEEPKVQINKDAERLSLENFNFL